MRKTTIMKNYLLCMIIVAVMTVFAFVDEAKADTQGYYTYSVNKTAKTATITAYTGDELEVKIPSTLGGYKVVKLGFQSFKGKKYMEKVTIPSTVTTIENSVFRDNVALKTITIPNTVKTIGSYMCGNCDALTTVTVGSGVKSLPTGVFANCDALTTVKLLEGLETICGNAGNYGAFGYCRALKNITIPSTVTTIQEFSFYNCDALTEVVVPNKVKTIGGYAFSSCDSLKKLTIGSGVTTLYAQCAYNNINLKEVVFLGNKLSYIDDYAFGACTALEEICLPSSIDELGSSVFSGCSSLKKVKLNEGLRNLAGSLFGSCKALEEITIPSSVVNFSSTAFIGCSNLKTVILKANININNNNPFSSIGCAKEGVLVKAYSNNEFRDGIDIPYYNTKYHRVEYMDAVPSTSIEFSKKSVKVGFGSKVKMPATMTPANTTDSILYTTSNSKIASVTQRGEIEGTGYGTATITARTNSGKLAQITVNVLPAKVKGFKDVTRGTNSITLNWNEQSNVDGYYIYRKVNGIWKNIGHVYKDYYNDVNKYVVTGLAAGSKYQFAINAYDLVNGREKYLSISFPTVTTLTKPAKVTNFKKVSASRTAIKTTWQKVSGANGYIVYRYSNKKWVRVATTKNNYYTYTKLSKNTYYKFCVKAYKTVGTKTEYGATTTLTSKTSK